MRAQEEESKTQPSQKNRSEDRPLQKRPPRKAAATKAERKSGHDGPWSAFEFFILELGVVGYTSSLLASYRIYASVMYCCTMRWVLKNEPLMAMACCITLKYLCGSL